MSGWDKELFWGPPIGFFNPVIFPQSRNPDGFYQLIPIPNTRFEKFFAEVPDSLISGEPVDDGGIRKVVRSKIARDRVEENVDNLR